MDKTLNERAKECLDTLCSLKANYYTGVSKFFMGKELEDLTLVISRLILDQQIHIKDLERRISSGNKFTGTRQLTQVTEAEVEAAARAIFENDNHGKWEEIRTNMYRAAYYIYTAKAALEAAAKVRDEYGR